MTSIACASGTGSASALAEPGRLATRAAAGAACAGRASVRGPTDARPLRRSPVAVRAKHEAQAVRVV